jgi:hypothetical protein
MGHTDETLDLLLTVFLVLFVPLTLLLAQMAPILQLGGSRMLNPIWVPLILLPTVASILSALVVRSYHHRG